MISPLRVFAVSALLLFAVFSLSAKEPKTYPVTAELPKGIQWQTAMPKDHFPGYQPKKGGKFVDYILSYPQTFRLYGPNSNSGGFVGYNRRYAFLSLTKLDKNTNEYLPSLATHWAVMPDNKTVYYKLDPDARWSDGKKITADDYLFAVEFLLSPHIKSPFYTEYMKQHHESIDKIDDYTIKLVSKKPSWRVLYQIDISPLPRHAVQLDENWVEKANWLPNVVPGPYVISKFKKNDFIEFKRIKDWWGYKKPVFRHLYHFDKIRLKTIRTADIAYEQFKKGKLSLFVANSQIWQNKTDIEEIQNGYIVKRRYYRDTFSGQSGLFFNTGDSVWGDKNLRKAFAHTIDFENMNKSLFYDLYQRKHNYFDVYPPYKVPGIRSPDFDLKKAQEILEKAGWKRTDTSQGYREKNGKRLVLETITGNDAAVRYLTFMRETAVKAGIDMRISKRDGAAFFQIVNERNFQAISLGFGGSIFPSPRQMLHTEFLKPNTNNIFMFGNKEVDELIDVYEFDMDESKRIDAITRIEKTVSENLPIVLFWKSNSNQLLYWNYIKGPEKFGYKTGYDFDLLHFDSEAAENLEEAMDDDKPMKALPVDFDPYGLKP